MTKKDNHDACASPEQSNIEAYQNFCKKRLFGIDMLCSILFTLIGTICSTLIILPLFQTTPQPIGQIFQIIYTSPVQLILVLWMFCILGTILMGKKWHRANFKFYVTVPLILLFLTSILDTYPTQLLSNSVYTSIWISLFLAFGMLSMIVGGTSIYYIVHGYSTAKSTLPHIYEHQAESHHTGILIPVNPMRLADFSSIEGISHLAEGFFKIKKEPYRIYCCFTKNEVEKVITNPQAINLWIFGHGSRGGVDVADGPFYYDSLAERDIPKKGYIQQYHCNCWINEHDNTSLVDLLVDENDRKRSTDTGTQNWFLRQLCKCPLISRIGNYFLNTRNLRDNKKGIKQYLLELENTD